MSEKDKDVTKEMLCAGKMYKQSVNVGGKEYVVHRLSIEEKIKVGVRTAQRTNEVKVDDMTYNLAYAASWLDVALGPVGLDPAENTDWHGSAQVFDTSFLMELYQKCWDAVEKPFFRSKSAGDETAKAVEANNK